MSRISRISLVSAVLPACLMVLSLPGSAQTAQANPAKLLDRNLLRNSGAETTVKETLASGWRSKSGVESAQYGSMPGEWDAGVPGAPGGGQRYFRLEFQSPATDKSATQPVNVAALAQQIDAGVVSAKVSGQLGGLAGTDSGVQFIAVFEDAKGKVLGNLTTDEVNTQSLPAASAGNASLVMREKEKTVPVGTRRIVAQLFVHPTGDSGRYLGLADNLALVLSRAQTK